MTNTDLQRRGAAAHRPVPQPVARPSKPLARGLAIGLGLALSLSLAACGGGGGNNNCGSAGNTRVLHCAP